MTISWFPLPAGTQSLAMPSAVRISLASRASRPGTVIRFLTGAKENRCAGSAKAVLPPDPLWPKPPAGRTGFAPLSPIPRSE